MHLLLLGVSHRTAPVELRERIDFSSGGLDHALAALAQRPGTKEVVVVSTCNRAELYVACDDPTAAGDDLVRFLSEYHQLPADALRAHIYKHHDADAARHLFRVASGLDSLVVGEPQIMGQVKEAYGVATTLQTAGPLLNKLFHWSFGVGKRVRSETALAEGAVSVSFAAVALARKIFGTLTGRRVLVVGAGAMGKLTAQHLKAQGIGRLTITSRTLANAKALADAVEGEVMPWERLAEALRESDIVITSTGSAMPVLTRAMVRSAVPSSRTQPLFLIDIAVPRDVEPGAGDIEQVFLYNIDDLQAIVRDNLTKRSAEVGKAEQIVDDEVKRFAQWQRARGAIPTVVALRQRFEEIRRTELQRLEPKLAHLPPEARGRVEEITRLIVEKLLLQPTEQLKTVPDAQTMEAYSDALSRLFALEAAAHHQAPPRAGSPAEAAPPVEPAPAGRPAGAATDPVRS